ncbi:response regulator [Halalkalibacter alkalisediminis]|uniref:Response regulator n=1 Tax=Halalkalibacter alkalisediminis TaxID=935616 RepID=A0ABV6NKB3_9BACI|nr:response regulator [Halalkalibacter alkalisediminis]
MLKAVIFDDEYIVTQGLKTMINWSQYGIEVVGTASDGISALKLFKQLKPDIIFTDIRMPGMDGLELIQEVMQEVPETICIVFSGFNEFSYVKKAIKLGVADYLEKPVTIPMIEEAIQRTLKKVNEQNEMTTLKLEREKTQQELLEKATLDLLLNRQGAYSKWCEHFGPEVNRVVAATVIAYSGDEKVSITNDLFRMVPVWNGYRDLLVVFHFSEEFGLFERELASWMKQTNGLVGAGHTYKRISNLSKSYSEALKALEYGSFIEEEGWIHVGDLPDEMVIPEYLSEQVKGILSSMRKGDEEETEHSLDQFIKWIEMEKFDRDILEREILKMIYLGIEVVKEISGGQLSNWIASYQPYIEIRNVKTKDAMVKWLRDQMKEMMDRILKHSSTKKHSAINQALEYMKEHFCEDLTLQQVAEKVDMNPTYLSYLFKEEMGESYIKYLTRLRMEQAKSLLRSGQKVSTVSEQVGYQTYRHFSEVFKKHTGMTPSHFKDFR